MDFSASAPGLNVPRMRRLADTQGLHEDKTIKECSAKQLAEFRHIPV